MPVTQDAYSRKYCPASTAEWTELLSGLGLNAPSSIWLCQETSGNLADSGSGGRTCTVAGSPAYFQTAPGWQRKGIRTTDGSMTQIGSVTIPSVSTTSSMVLQMFALDGTTSSTRDVNHIGTSTVSNARMLASNKLRGTSGANTTDGDQQNAGVLVVITKLDRANNVLGVYTRHEQIKPTYSAPGASATMYLFGGGSGALGATLVYAAYWSGADAEIGDDKIQTLLNALDGAESTRVKMQAGSFAHKWVVSIEGCPYLLSDAPSAAVINAYAGRDWTQVLGGLFVELNNSQGISPLEPFTTTGRCTLRILDVDQTDTFGRFVARRAGGYDTAITATIDNNDTTIDVKNTAGFSPSGEIYIGTECIGYTGKTATSFTGCTRGKYSPFGTAQSGSGGIRFGNPHRVGTDANQVQTRPVVSSIPRVWIGKRVAVRLHTWDEANQAINSRAESQLVFAGQIGGISDDHNTGQTVIELDHMMLGIKDAVIWQDPLVGEATPGLSLIAGRRFKFEEFMSGSPTANDLVVVSGTPASTNEIKEGTYSLSELCEALNRWLGEEKRAGRINGQYSYSSPASNNEGIRTVCHWFNNTPSDSYAGWWLTMPADVASFLGVTEGEPVSGGTAVAWGSGLWPENRNQTTSGKAAPFTSLIFRPFGGGRIGQEFSDTASFIDLDNVTGSFVDQYAKLPASIKAACDPSAPWGVFLFDEKLLIVGTYDASTQRLKNIWLAPFQFAGNNDAAASTHFGRRADEQDAGPVRIRQILLMEGQFSELLLELIYSTGATGYNHATYDTLGPGIGSGQPGELFGPEFEYSLWNLPNASQPLLFLLDEPTKLSELIGSDLNFRLAFMRWKDGNFEIAQWRTPLNANAIATLSEDSKSAPAGETANHRVASQETNEYVRPVIKIDYGRDFAVGRNGDYLRSFTFQDQTSVGDLGAGARPATIKLRNTFQQFANMGASVEAGLPDFMARMPAISRTSREVNRSLDHRYVELLSPGDIVTLEDNFARDPLTGIRGVNSRAAFVTSVSYDLGGSGATPGSDPRPYSGDITCNFLDTQRGRSYAPSADIDETQNSGGFSAGYNSATLTVRCYDKHYSHTLWLITKRGLRYVTEAADASNFVAGDKILIIERDPVDPANPLYWERTVASQSGNDLALTVALNAPAWDSAKRYRIVPQKYSQVQTSQRDVAYQADSDEWVEDIEIPWHFSATDENTDFYENSTAPAEFVPDLSYGDGRPWDVGHDAAIAKTANALIDYKTAHQAPALWTSVRASVFAGTDPTWVTLFFGPMFVGSDIPSSTVTRSLTVAPFFRSNTAGNTAKVRVTIMERPPTMSINPGFLPGECFKNSVINSRYSRTAVWTTTSTTWQTGTDKTLSLSVKDLNYGFIWVLVEGTGYVECRGLAKCIEGSRVI